MIRALLVAKDLYGYGGVNNVANSLARRMSDQVEFHVLAARVNDGEGWIKEHLALPKPGRLPFVDIVEVPLRSRGRIKDVIERIKPDIVHVHTPAFIPPKGAPSLVTVHGTYYRDVPNLLSYPISPAYKLFLSSLIYSQYRFERFALKYYDHFHAVSSMTGEELALMGVPRSAISMVPNGVDTAEFRPAEVPGDLYQKLGIREGAKMVLYVGTITPRKGAHLIVRAARDVLAKHPDATFVFVGSCPNLGKSYLNKMRDYAKGAGIEDRIHFVGQVAQKDLSPLYNACSAFVSASYTEGCSLNILEAAACGKPIVSTDVGGARDVLGGAGIYVPVNDPSGLAQGINKALDFTNGTVPGLRSRMEEKFSWERIAKDMLSVYVHTIENRA